MKTCQLGKYLDKVKKQCSSPLSPFRVSDTLLSKSVIVNTITCRTERNVKERIQIGTVNSRYLDFDYLE